MSFVRAVTVGGGPGSRRSQGAAAQSRHQVHHQGREHLAGRSAEAVQRQDRAVRLGAGALGGAHRAAPTRSSSAASPTPGRGWRRWPRPAIPAPLAKSLTGTSGVVAVGRRRPAGGRRRRAGPITPGQGYEFEIDGRRRARRSRWRGCSASRTTCSTRNDRPIALFDAAGKPVQGDMTAQLALWDAGTEVNEEPGLGPNQGPRQKTPGRRRRGAPGRSRTCATGSAIRGRRTCCG